MIARRYLAWRQKRGQMVAPGLFEDPAWDMLLDLFSSHIEGKHICVTSASIASGAATTTALRWIDRLEAKGLIVRHRDLNDGRRTLVRITNEAAEALTRWLIATFPD